VNNCRGSTISLGVWSAKGQRIREIYVPIPTDGGLGLSLQWTTLATTDDVWHVLDVTPNSPADLAGLLPYGDYVIGSPEGLVRGENGIGELVEDFIDRPLRLQVYNHEYNLTRPVTITPSRSWGGQGALGCVLGFGALHRLPAALEEPPHAPGETLFATDTDIHDPSQAAVYDEKRPLSAIESPQPSSPHTEQQGDFIVPAMMNLPPTTPPVPKSPTLTDGNGPSRSGPQRSRKARAHHPAIAMDDYFKEGEEKSKEQDYAPSTKAGALPPPPKMGGPPRAASAGLEEKAESPTAELPTET